MEVNDLISRQAAIDAIRKLESGEDFNFNNGLICAMNNIDELPSAQPTEASCWGCNCPKMERLKEQKTFSEMVHLHDAETHEERTETHGVCLDTISRQMAIDAFKKELTVGESKGNYVTLCSAVSYEGAKQILESLPSAQPEKVCIANITLSEEQIREAVEKAKEELKNSPILIEPEQRWIPCSERLPDEKEDTYWICTDSGYQCECRWTNDRWGFGGSDTWGWKPIDIPQYTKVVAWMPLPDPWKGAEHETD